MRIVHRNDIEAEPDESPRKSFAASWFGISHALGRDPNSTDLMHRHPFDVEIMRVEAGRRPYPYHSHSSQWEFYFVLSGNGHVRHPGGTSPITAGDSLLFKPGEAHQLYAADDCALEVIIVADNPIGESTHYPDSDKWIVRSPERRIIRSSDLDYYDGEE